jgi:hypothetical protein
VISLKGDKTIPGIARLHSVSIVPVLTPLLLLRKKVYCLLYGTGFLDFYFHSHSTAERFPSLSTSGLKTLIMLLRKASSPVEGVFQNPAPRYNTLPSFVRFPIT